MNNNINNDVNNNVNIDNNYRNIVFDYIGGTTSGNSSTDSNKAKHVYNITGKDGKFSYIFFILSIILSIVFNYIQAMDSSVVVLGFFENAMIIIDKSNFLYKILKPMVFFDIRFAIFVFVILLVIIRRKMIYKKLEPKGTSINIYSRELPSKLRPAHMRILLKDGLIDKVSMGSTIIDLIDKGYLNYYKERNEEDKLNFFHNKDAKLIKTNKPHDNLLKYEKYLIDWFINEYGNGVEVTATQVNKGLMNKQNFSNMEPADMFYEWQALVLMSFPMDKYYTKVKGLKFEYVYLLLGVIGFFTLTTFIGAILLIYGFGMPMFASPSRGLNQQGVDEICEWLSLKKFLVDFGDMNNKTADMVAIWDFYLTYSIALNVSKKASNEINNFFNDNIYLGSFEEDFQSTSPINYDKDLKLEIEEEYKKL